MIKHQINNNIFMGIGDWGLGIGDWGLGPIPNPQSPIPNPQSPIPILLFYFIKKYKLNIKYSLSLYNDNIYKIIYNLINLFFIIFIIII